MIKRRSNKQSLTQELPEYTFFTDRNLGHNFPGTLRKNGFVVEIHDDHFDQNTPDSEWLDVVGKNGWIVITHDKHIRKRSYEVDALMFAKAQAFFLIGAAPFADLANNFVNTKARTTRFIRKNDFPFMAKLYRPPPNKPGKPGDIKMWYTYAQWLIGNPPRK